MVEYNPRTKVATLLVEEGKVRGIITAAGRQVERLISTAKQVSVNAKTGVVTAVVDADLAKIRNEFGDQVFKGADNEVAEIFLSLDCPTEVKGGKVPFDGTVSDPTVREIVVAIGGADGQDRRVRVPVRQGKFAGEVQVPKGETRLEFEVRNPAGKKTVRKEKVRSIE